LNILVVAAHPDDEVLGCGGTIRKHVENEDEVHVLIMADGVSSRFGGTLRRTEEAKKSAEILGVSTIEFLEYPDNRMSDSDILSAAKDVEDKIAKVLPEVVYTHHNGDLNVDHRVVHEAVLVACRPQPGHPVKRVLFFEVPSSTEWRQSTFSPNSFNDITSTLRYKIAAMSCYESELRDYPHARSLDAIENLARWRGATVGVNSAEAFMLGREIR